MHYALCIMHCELCIVNYALTNFNLVKLDKIPNEVVSLHVKQ